MSNKWRCRHMGTWSIVPYIKHVLIFHWTKIDGPTWLISNFPFNIDPNSSLPIDKMAGCQTIISLNIDGPQIAQLNNMIYIYTYYIFLYVFLLVVLHSMSSTSGFFHRTTQASSPWRIFDRSWAKPWTARTFRRTRTPAMGKAKTILMVTPDI